MDGVIQRGQQVGKERHNIQKVVEEDVVDREPEKAYRQPASIDQPSSRTQRRAQR